MQPIGSGHVVSCWWSKCFRLLLFKIVSGVCAPGDGPPLREGGRWPGAARLPVRAGFLAWTQTFERLIAPRGPDRQLYYESWHAEWAAFTDILYLSLCVKVGESQVAEERGEEGGRELAGGVECRAGFMHGARCRLRNKEGLLGTNLFCSLSSLNECQSRQGGFDR